MKSQEWRDCSEEELQKRVRDWVRHELASLVHSIVFLEGDMGAGKSTFARAMLAELSPHQVSKGSPTFPIVQEYPSDHGKIYHIDLYRIRHEAELEDSGILSQIEERDSLALIEWASLFPAAFEFWKKKGAPKPAWQISIRLGTQSHLRDVKITPY